MRDRVKSTGVKTNRDYLVPRAATEILALNYLHSKGIPALPGKALRHSHVDVIAFGCVDIEIKYSRLEYKGMEEQFVFTATRAQQYGGFRAQIVILVCDWNDKVTYHLFKTDNPVFYLKGRVKNGLTFTPGRLVAKKHGNNRVVMVQSMMDEAQDNLTLIYEQLRAVSQKLKEVG
jgi:hypothetical protein